MVVYHLSCGLVIYRKTVNGPLFLLLHYLGGHWGFPKGHVEGEETEEQTALRELDEETGIKHAFILPNFREKMTYSYYHLGERHDKDVVFMLAETDEEKVVLSDEHQGYIWLPYDKCLQQLTFDNARAIFQSAGSYLGIK